MTHGSYAGPTVRGITDYWCGGRSHTAADREHAGRVAAEFPLVPAEVRAACAFHLRAARWAAEQGISRFLLAGPVAWEPGGGSAHEAAREVIPGARAVYVIWEEGACAWARALFAGDPGLAAVRACAGQPAAVLAAPPAAALLAPGEPVCLVLGLLLHFFPGPEAAGIVSAYAAALPPGSAVAVSAACRDSSPQGARLRRMSAQARAYPHAMRDIAGWLEGAGLGIVPPGVRDVRPVREVETGPPGLIACAVAVSARRSAGRRGGSPGPGQIPP
jgi:S-adenosyl methyltransferase